MGPRTGAGGGRAGPISPPFLTEAEFEQAKDFFRRVINHYLEGGPRPEVPTGCAHNFVQMRDEKSHPVILYFLDETGDGVTQRARVFCSRCGEARNISYRASDG